MLNVFLITLQWFFIRYSDFFLGNFKCKIPKNRLTGLNKIVNIVQTGISLLFHNE
jgi:hypothetical protein